MKDFPSFAQLGEATWFSTSNTCEIYASVHYKIVYAETGFTENLQKYIVEVERSAHPINWRYNRKSATGEEEQDFEVMVSFQFVKLEEDDLNSSTASETSWWTLDEDIFYPFSTKSSAEEGLKMALTAAVAVAGLFAM